MALKTEALQVKVATEYLKETDAIKSRLQGVNGSITNGVTNLKNLKTLLADNNLDPDGSKTADIDAWLTWLADAKAAFNNLPAMPE